MTYNLIDRIRLRFRKEKELYLSLYSIMGFYPHDIQIYQQALMHKSAAQKNVKGRPLNNERLEFLGDAILDAIVGDIVFRHFEGKREGFLTNTRSKIVQRDTLNKLASEMGLGQLIKSSGHSSSHNSYMGGNAFEALVGAIYLDRGYDFCMRFMQKRILAQLINIDKVAYKEVNFKSKLIEWSQKNRVEVDFRLLSQDKEENGSPIFTYQVFMESLEGGKGRGYSKKESQQEAAKETLEKLRRKPQFIDNVFAAKGKRTQQEEEPVEEVPDTKEKEDFIITKDIDEQGLTAKEPEELIVQDKVKTEDTKESFVEEQVTIFKKDYEKSTKDNKTQESDLKSEFDLSDITANPKDLTEEEIIAAAEAAAFAGKE
jgi:ribonuclease III